MDELRFLSELGDRVVAELARRGLAASHSDCTGPAFGVLEMPGRLVVVAGREERLTIRVEDETLAWIELTTAGVAASAEVVTTPLADPDSVRWLADLASGSWRVRRTVLGRRQVWVSRDDPRLSI